MSTGSTRAKVKAIVCTHDGEVCEHVEASLPESPSMKLLLTANGRREGWLDLDEGMECSSDMFERPAVTNSRDDLMLMYFTSGTTGYPKIAAHSFTYPLGHVVTARYWHNVRSRRRTFRYLRYGLGQGCLGQAVWPMAV